LNRRTLALGVLAVACAPPTGEKFTGTLRIGFEESLFWPAGRADGPWSVSAAKPVMETITKAVAAANGGYPFGGIRADVLGELGPEKPAGRTNAARRQLRVLRLIASAPEDFTARG
jgi:hypothetical protein